MTDLLAAARQALPGLEWTEIGPEVRAYIGQQLVYLTGRGSDGVFVYAGPDSHRWMPTIDEAAQWLRAQVEARRNALDAALGQGDAAEAKRKALAPLVERWPVCPHWHDCAVWTRGGDCTCGAAEADLARAEARRLLGVNNG